MKLKNLVPKILRLIVVKIQRKIIKTKFNFYAFYGIDGLRYLANIDYINKRTLELRYRFFKKNNIEFGKSYLGKTYKEFDKNKKTILIITHEASFTGAPILCLNLAQKFSKNYNVIVVTLGGGSLLVEFIPYCVQVFFLKISKYKIDNRTYGFFKKIKNKYNIAFSFVNSIVSRIILPITKDNNIPSVTLLHEFASYTLPIGAFSDAISFSDKTVFSSHIILDDAKKFGGISYAFDADVLHQGRCRVPQNLIERAGADDVITFIEKAKNKGHFIVLGAGYVQYRKGVDLFINIAINVINRDPHRTYKFIWIGDGYNPDFDHSYGVYLKDQIRRAGLIDNILIFPSTTQIENAYSFADLFLLSSRLDPYPNVAIDSLCEGTPVICFRKTTGIVEFLDNVNVADECVADYENTYDIVQKIITLANDPKALTKLSMYLKTEAGKQFDMDVYIKRLEDIGYQAQEKVKGKAL